MKPKTGQAIPGSHYSAGTLPRRRALPDDRHVPGKAHEVDLCLGQTIREPAIMSKLSVFRNPGGPRLWIALFSAATQKLALSIFDIRSPAGSGCATACG